MRLRVARKVLFGGRERFQYEGCRLVSRSEVYTVAAVERARRRWRKWRRRHPDARAVRLRPPPPGLTSGGW